MSRVFRVRDQALDRQTALKVLRSELVTDPGAIERFITEAKITAQLDHPNIPPVYAMAVEKKTACFTMKVLEGVTLQQLIEQRRGDTSLLLPTLEVMLRVCDAVAFAHARGIIHLDLKPHNVMVAEHGQIYLVDWGLARRKTDLPTADTDDHSSIGTPAYMAPEQARGLNHALDERTDIFMVGGMLYRILIGRPPYVGTTADETLALAQKAVIAPPELLAAPGVQVFSRVAAIAMRALATEPSERYQTMAELRRDLEDFVHGTARLPERTYLPGEIIVREGEPGDCAFIIRDGHCEVCRLVQGRVQKLRLLGPGEMFGEAAVLTQGARLATVTVMVDTRVAVVDRSFLEEEMQRSTLVALAIRAVAGTVVGMNAQTSALLQDQIASKAVEESLRELAVKGAATEDGLSRWVGWSALRARLIEKTGLEPQALVELLSKQRGFSIDVTADRLLLRS